MGDQATDDAADDAGLAVVEAWPDEKAEDCARRVFGPWARVLDEDGLLDGPVVGYVTQGDEGWIVITVEHD